MGQRQELGYFGTIPLAEAARAPSSPYDLFMYSLTHSRCEGRVLA